MDPEISELLSIVSSLYSSTESSRSTDDFIRPHLFEIISHLESIPRSPVRLAVRVFVGPCMDLIHSGHFNFLRQAKRLGDVLVVGVISDEEILKAKGPPVMNLQERAAVISACKWVDEVHLGVDYAGTIEILDRYRCDFLVHGDDLAIRKDTGEDALAELKRVGRIRIVKRTEGVSTTEMVGRMLLMTEINREHVEPQQVSKILKDPSVSSFLASARRITQFSNTKVPGPTDKIVYVDGSFDLLHMGHINTIKAARELGDFLIVGVHDDKIVNLHKGKNFPIMNLHERCLNLLALADVDDVIMGAPWAITEDMIKTLNISLVVQGSHHKNMPEDDIIDPYIIPKALGIYREIQSSVNLSTDIIIERIIRNRQNYVERNQRLVAKELDYYENKKYVSEI